MGKTFLKNGGAMAHIFKKWWPIGTGSKVLVSPFLKNGGEWHGVQGRVGRTTTTTTTTARNGNNRVHEP